MMVGRATTQPQFSEILPPTLYFPSFYLTPPTPLHFCFQFRQLFAHLLTNLYNFYSKIHLYYIIKTDFRVEIYIKSNEIYIFITFLGQKNSTLLHYFLYIITRYRKENNNVSIKCTLYR